MIRIKRKSGERIDIYIQHIYLESNVLFWNLFHISGSYFQRTSELNKLYIRRDIKFFAKEQFYLKWQKINCKKNLIKFHPFCLKIRKNITDMSVKENRFRFRTSFEYSNGRTYMNVHIYFKDGWGQNGPYVIMSRRSTINVSRIPSHYWIWNELRWGWVKTKTHA